MRRREIIRELEEAQSDHKRWKAAYDHCPDKDGAVGQYYFRYMNRAEDKIRQLKEQL